MKKNYYSSCFVLIQLVLSITLKAQMSGNYTVGGTSPDYATLHEACNELVSQGVAGPVVINIRNGSYNETVTLETVNGVSATNTITFQSESGNKKDVILEHATDTVFESPNSFLIFQNLTFICNGPNPGVNLFLKGSDYTVNNCNLFTSDIFSGSLSVLIYNTTTDIKNINITNSKLTGYSGMVLQGKNLENINIENDTILTQNIGVYVNAGLTFKDFTVNNCLVDSVSSVFVVCIANEKYENISIRNSSIKSKDAACVFSGKIMENFVFNNNNIDCKSTGVGLLLIEDISDVEISNSTINSTSGSAIVLTNSVNNCTNINISNTDINFYASGIYIYAEKVADNITIDSCKLTGNMANATGAGISVSGSYAQASNVEITNTSIESTGYGVNLYSAELCKNFYINNVTTDVFFKAINIEGTYQSIDSVEIINSGLESSNEEAVDFYSQYNVSNIIFENCSTVSSLSDGIAIISESGDIKNVSLDEIYAKNIDTLNCCDHGLNLYSANGSIGNINIINSEFIGYRPVYLYAQVDINDIKIDNVNIRGNEDGLYIYSELNDMNSLDISNANILTTNGDGIHIYGGQAKLDGLNIDNVNIDAENDNDIDMNLNGGAENISITNSTLNSPNFSGFVYQGYMGGAKNFEINNCTFKTNFGGISFDQTLHHIRDINIHDNNIYTENSWCVYFDTDDSKIDNLVLKNNTLKGLSGAYMNADYGGVNNTLITGNDINIMSTDGLGIQVQHAGHDISIEKNLIDTLTGSAYLGYGINITGQSNPTYNLNINENVIYNAYYEGINVGSSVYNIDITNNSIFNDIGSTNMTGIILNQIDNGYMNITGNKIISNSEDYGIDIEYVSIAEPNRGIVANNFITGFNYSLYISEANNVSIVNNSLSKYNNSGYFMETGNECYNIEILNNIFHCNPAIFSQQVYIIDNSNNIAAMDNNVYNIDTLLANLAYVNDDALYYNSVNDWQNVAGFDENSFYYNAEFVNDTTNLHLTCSNPDLVAGERLSYVPLDVDGVYRSNVPTIGAHEILSNNSQFFAVASATICGEPKVLEVGDMYNATYSWNTGAVTPSITVGAAGLYTITVTNDCGSYSDNIRLVNSIEPVALFEFETSYLTTSFTNTSTNAVSYLWNFNDGDQSTDVNPVHVYNNEETYNVRLTAYSECGNSATYTANVTVATTSIDGEIIEMEGVKVYPNPSDGRFILEYYGIVPVKLIYIFDFEGRMIFETSDISQDYTLDLTGFGAGIYYLQIHTADKVQNTKLIVNK